MLMSAAKNAMQWNDSTGLPAEDPHSPFQAPTWAALRTPDEASAACLHCPCLCRRPPATFSAAALPAQQRLRLS